MQHHHHFKKSLRFTSVCHIPSCLHAYMIGAKHAVRKQMEKETSTQIQYPPRGSTSSNITVAGERRSWVKSCVTRLQLMSSDIRWRVPFTHFVSVKLGEFTCRWRHQVFKTRLIVCVRRQACKSAFGEHQFVLNILKLEMAS